MSIIFISNFFIFILLYLFPQLISYKIEIIAGSNYHLTKVQSSQNGQIFSGETPPGKFIYLNNFRSTFFNIITLTIKAKGGEDFWLGGYVMISYYKMGPMWDFNYKSYCSKMTTFTIEEYNLTAKGCLKDNLLPQYKNSNNEYTVNFTFTIPCPYDINYLMPQKERINDWIEFQFGRDYFYVGHGKRITFNTFNVTVLNMTLNVYNSSVYYPEKQIISKSYQPPQFDSCYDTIVHNVLIKRPEKYWLYGAFLYFNGKYHVAYYQDICPSRVITMTYIPDNLNWTEAHDDIQSMIPETRWWESHTVKNSALFFDTYIVYRICQTLCESCSRYNGCTSCISGYELINGSCVNKTCPENCEYCAEDKGEIICLHCKKGYSILEGNFSKCVNDEIFNLSIYYGHDYLTGEISDDRKFLYHRLYNLTEHCEKGSYNYCEQCEPDYYILNNDFTKCVYVNEMKNECCGEFEINSTYSENFKNQYQLLCVDNCKKCIMKNIINKNDNSSKLITKCAICSNGFSFAIDKEGVTQCVNDSILNSSSYYEKEENSTIYHKPIPIKNCIKYDSNYNCEKCKKNYALYIHKTGQECKISTSHSTSNLNMSNLEGNVIYDQPKGYMHNEDYTYYHYCESSNCEKIIIYTSKCIEILTHIKSPIYFYETCSKCQNGYGVTKFGCIQLNQLSNYYKVNAITPDGKEYEYYLECLRLCSKCSRGNYCDVCSSEHFRRGLDSERNNLINDCYSTSMQKYYYKVNDDYYPCLPNCQSCNGPDTCNQCSNGFSISKDKTQCICTSIPNCFDCKDKYCLKCNDGYAIVDKNYEKCINILELNEEYYTDDNGITYFLCINKFENCKLCSKDNCHLCNEEYDLVFNNENNNTICVHKNNTKKGYYNNKIVSKYNQTILFKCMENCDICNISLSNFFLYNDFQSENEFFGNISDLYYFKLLNSEIFCLKCSNNFAFLNHRNYKCYNISTFGKGYIKEDDMNYLTNCSINCESCEEDSTCIECFKNYSFIDDFPDECILTNEYLTKGGYYYIKEENKFYSCLHGCNECIKKRICKRCFNGYLINNEKTKCDFISDEMRCKYNCNKLPISTLSESTIQNLVKAYSTGYLHDDSTVEIYRENGIKYMIMIFKNINCSNIFGIEIPCLYDIDFKKRKLEENENINFNSENLTNKMIEATGQERLIQTFIKIENKVVYSFYDERTGTKYKIDDYCKDCKNEKILIKKNFSNYITNNKLSQNEINKILNLEINIFDSNNKFFNDICISYSVNDTDITLEKRIEYFYQYYSLDNLCGENCTINSIIYNEKTIICSFDFSDSINDLSISTSNQIIETHIFERKINTNIYKSFYCQFKNFKKNIGSYIILGCIIIQIICFTILLVFKRNISNFANPPIKITNAFPITEKSNSNFEDKREFNEINEKIKIEFNKELKNEKENFWKNYFQILIKYNNIISLILMRDFINIILRIIVIIFMFAFCIFINIFFIDNDYISKKFDYALNLKYKINHWEYAFEHIKIKIIFSIIFGIIVDLIFQFLVFRIISNKKNNISLFHFIIFGIIIILMFFFWFFISSFNNIFSKTFIDVFLRGIISFFIIIIFSFIYCLVFNIYNKYTRNNFKF